MKAENKSTTTPTIVIVGQTATGKSALAIKLAHQVGGEIICADSRTVYKHLDIGTAKPTAHDQAAIPHHGLDLIEPNESFSASAFKEYAEKKVCEIHKRGRVPVIVGGTGLYIDGYVYDYTFAPPASAERRAELAAMTVDQLQAEARAVGINETAVDFRNPRHLSRAIERGAATPERQAMRPNLLLIGLSIESAVLKKRISDRVDTMFDSGLVEETQNVITRYGADVPGLLAPGYKAVRQYLAQAMSLSEAKNEFKRSDRYLAKRQQTWFKKNPDIQWARSKDEAVTMVHRYFERIDASYPLGV